MNFNSGTSKDLSKSQILTDNDTEKIETEKINNSAWLDRKSFRISLIGTFTALAIVLGYLMAYIPNLEVFTLMIFLSGFIMSKKEGAIIGLLSASIFTFFNPLGPSPPPLFIYQLIHYSMTGVLGGLTKSFLYNKEYFKPNEDLYIFRIMLLFGFLGAVITFIFDILSTLFGGFTVSITIDYFIATYLLGIVFTTVHLIGNILIFVFLLPGLIQLITKLLD
ncbi:MAG: hypothetical protein HWN80_09460 [Candidatus Lokiarchaeota archaeon]|nr:hypothetical protein [Candidatus Lokiarchaeota archaeon]